MKNKISKIILMASLLASGITTAQEFYTCVPKKDWWLDIVREGNKKQWKKIIHLTPQSPQSDFQQTLQAGKYRVTAAGAGGEPETKEFTLTTVSEFKACAGASGGDGTTASYKEFSGGGGGGGGGNGYNGIYKGENGKDGGCLKKNRADIVPCFNNKGGEGDFILATNAIGSIGGKGGSGGGGGVTSSGYQKLDSNGAVSGNGGKGYGYGKGKGGDGGVADNVNGYGKGGEGCYSGGGGSGGYIKKMPIHNNSGLLKVAHLAGNGGGGGGSYFAIVNIEMILKGGDGKDATDVNKYGKGAAPDGYVIIERLE